MPVYIYSSGSVEAQQLLFAHTEHGDLLPVCYCVLFAPQLGGPRVGVAFRWVGCQIGRTVLLVCVPLKISVHCRHWEMELGVFCSMR